MRRDLIGAVRALALPTLALVVVAVLAPGRAELALRIYGLLVCATVIVVLLLALRRSYPAESELSPPVPAARRSGSPRSLERLENEALLGAASAFDLHYRLAPRLRGIAAGLVRSRRGVSLETETARRILGEEVWELVRADRPAPEDRRARGISTAELARVVQTLESV